VKIKLGALRRLIREALLSEWAGSPPTKPMFDYVNNPLSPNLADREQLGSLANTDEAPEDDLPDHLREPELTPEECYGPVPPDAPDPYVQADPFVKSHSPIPTPGIRR